MSHAVLKINSKQLERIKQVYKKDLLPSVPPGGIFMAKINGCTITAYRSGKILFQGPRAKEESMRWSLKSETVSNNTTRNRPRHRYVPPNHVASLSLIGSDEVGTGDFFGPITVVAAYVSKSSLPLVKELGVKDSKLLKDSQIMNIAKDLIRTIPYSLMVLENEKYNELQKKGMSQGKMKAMLHQRAISNVVQKVTDPTEINGVLIDQFCEPDVYFRHTKEKLNQDVTHYFETKAEGLHLSVAAASIVARYAFLKKMDELSKIAGVSIPKGAGSLVDEAAAKIILKKGERLLGQISKVHFANTKKAKKIAQSRKER